MTTTVSFVNKILYDALSKKESALAKKRDGLQVQIDALRDEMKKLKASNE